MTTSAIFVLLFIGLTQANRLSYHAIDNGGIVGLITAPTLEDVDVEINLPPNVEVLGTFSGATHNAKQNSQQLNYVADELPEVADNNDLIKNTASILYKTLEEFAVSVFNAGVNYGVNLEEDEQKRLSNIVSNKLKPNWGLDHSKLGPGAHFLSSGEYEEKIQELEQQQDEVAIENFNLGLAVGLEVGSQTASRSSNTSPFNNGRHSSEKKHLHHKHRRPSSNFMKGRNNIQRELSASKSSTSSSSNQRK